MSLAQIEAELDKLSVEELRRLALKSWATMTAKTAVPSAECEEDDPELLAALDQAISAADSGKHKAYSADEVRAHLSKWTSK
jgi:hypothetical protein